MGGAAAVLGGMQAISRLDCRQRVVGLIPATENMTGPRAQRPGDVVRSYGGVTIEVLNTDAEGRLVLSDALGYAATLKPAAVVDAATLTGAVIAALGHHAAGLLGTDERLLRAVEAASATTGERVWRLPLWEVYDEPLKSKVADIKNIGDGGAGTIIGAAFLKRFVSYPWAHLDIAGAAWDVKDVSYLPSRATGYGARLFAELAAGWNGE
jgi:leucyl aminopeptidase